MMGLFRSKVRNGCVYYNRTLDHAKYLTFKGQYLGTLEDVNHLDLVGWINAARYKWAELTGREIKFRPATFYLGIADWLAAEVERVPKDDKAQDRKEASGKVGDGVRVSDGVAGEEQTREAPSGEEIEEGEDEENASRNTVARRGSLSDPIGRKALKTSSGASGNT